MTVEYDVREDLAFGVDESHTLDQLRELYAEALSQIASVNIFLDQYRAEAERLGWENSGLRHELRKAKLRLDMLLTASAKRGSA